MPIKSMPYLFCCLFLMLSCSSSSDNPSIAGFANLITSQNVIDLEDGCCEVSIITGDFNNDGITDIAVGRV